MEFKSNNRNKLKGLVKGKLVMMSFYKPTSKPPSYSTTAGSKVMKKPSTTNAPSPVEFMVKPEKVTPQPAKQMVSILLPQERSLDSVSNYANTSNIVDSYYATVAADEGVDNEAAIYISTVRERFRLQ
ncbi:hypothetical protein ACH5RR_014563 [Cinchona calisaya]|uniref:Uncharacterized protein n=1 Tax=Cinchona calisaya TaxID=153742 RepID=A0ABD3A371_9GENT